MDPDQAQEVIFDGQKVEQDPIIAPCDKAGGSTSHGVQNEMVGGGNNSGEDDGGINHADSNDSNAPPAQSARLSQGNGCNGESDKEGVSKVERRHGS